MELTKPINSAAAKKAINDCRETMVDTLDFDDIKDRLYSFDIITTRQIEKINAEKGNGNKISCLVSTLLKSDLQITFILFLKVLDKGDSGPGAAMTTCRNALLEAYKLAGRDNYVQTFLIVGKFIDF